MTVRSLRFAVCAMLLAAAGTASAADEVKFEFHGFVGASVFTENAGLSGNGGQAAWLVTKEPTTDKSLFGGDVRQTRINFGLTGPQLWEGATARGFAELDFFGGNTSGGFGDISIAPRLRVAFAELKLAKTGTVIRAGQDHDLVLGILLPATTGHVAYPLSYMNGTIGWRRPQVAVYQTVPVSNMKLEASAAVGRSGWNGTAATATEPSTERLGVASGLPSFEARAKLSGKIFEAFVAGHFSRIDTNGQGNATTPTGGTAGPNNSLDTTAVTAGGKVSYQGATLQGALYTGKNLGPLAGNLNQWQAMADLARADGPTDVNEIGGWAQLGYNITPELSAWALTGFANPDDKDLVRAGLTTARNSISSFMVRYQNKGYTAGVEYSLFRTSYTNAADPLTGSQFMLSGMYFF